MLATFQRLKSAGQFIPPSREGTIVFPGFDGGGEWGGPAFDPQTGLLYVNANEMAWVLRLVPQQSNAQIKSGKALYMNECAGCHRQDLAGTPPEFPSLQHISDKLDEGDVMTIMSQGAARMPSFAHLGSEDMHAIMRYVVYGEDVAVSTRGAEPSPIEQKYRIDGYNKFLDPDGYPATQPPWGTLNAINLNTGEYAWKIPFGEYPALAQQGMRNTGSENYGGGIVTANGLFLSRPQFTTRSFHVFDKSQRQTTVGDNASSSRQRHSRSV